MRKTINIIFAMAPVAAMLVAAVNAQTYMVQMSLSERKKAAHAFHIKTVKVSISNNDSLKEAFEGNPSLYEEGEAFLSYANGRYAEGGPIVAL